MKVALIGAKGQLSSDLEPVLRAKGWEIIPFTHADLDVADLKSVQAALVPARPHIAINTAAYHKVEDVENNPAQAFAVNAIGLRNLALVCQKLSSTLVHLSTDYVFSGSKRNPYVESDPVDPLNVYGISKAAGEMALRAVWPKHFILRTSGLYGHAGSAGKGGNFVELMLRLAQEEEPIRVVADQILTPTSTQALALQIAALIDTEAYGTYHATCQGECSWYAFAVEIFRSVGLYPDLRPQSTAESGARVKRPVYSVLENAQLKTIGIDLMPYWQEALRNYLRQRNTDR